MDQQREFDAITAILTTLEGFDAPSRQRVLAYAYAGRWPVLPTPTPQESAPRRDAPPDQLASPSVRTTNWIRAQVIDRLEDLFRGSRYVDILVYRDGQQEEHAGDILKDALVYLQEGS